MRNKIFPITLIFCLAALLTACGTPALAQVAGGDNTNPRTLSVNGSGKAYLTPDIAYLSIGVHTEDKDAAKAVTDNSTQSKKVSDALKAFKIELKDIQTTNFSIYPQQQFDENGQVTGIRYVVDNTVYVTLRDITKIGDILNAVVEAGANSINGIQFDVADRTEAISEARKSAVADALTQAEELAKEAGVTLGPIMNISSYGGYPVPMLEGKGGGGTAMAVEAPISPGQLVITVDVSVTYELK